MTSTSNDHPLSRQTGLKRPHSKMAEKMLDQYFSNIHYITAKAATI